MTYPSSLDELTDGVPSDGAAPTTALDNATYPHDDHHRALATAVEAVEAELGTDPSGSEATVKARIAATETVANAAAAKASNLSDLASASSARTNLGLGGAALLAVGTTAGTVAAGDDSRITGALSATTAASTYQPLDADLTAIAALSTTSFGRSLLTLANAGALLAAGLVVNTVAAAGTTETLDGDDYNIHDITLDESVTFTFTTSATVAQFTLILRQDGSGGNSVTWPGSVKWHSATAPTILTTASAVHVLEFLTVDAGTTWRGFLASSNVS